MTWKSAARLWTPPVLWNRLSRWKKETQGETKPDIILGENSTFSGYADKRATGKGIIQIGRDCVIQGHLVTETDEAKIEIGDNAFVNNETILECACSIFIGDDVMISYRCLIADTDNHSTAYSVRKDDLRKWRKGTFDFKTAKSAPVRIEKGAWVGNSAIILKGVTIGEGAVVGAGAVVTKSVAPYTIVAGNPARVVRSLSPSER